MKKRHKDFNRFLKCALSTSEYGRKSFTRNSATLFVMSAAFCEEDGCGLVNPLDSVVCDRPTFFGGCGGSSFRSGLESVVAFA